MQDNLSTYRWLFNRGVRYAADIVRARAVVERARAAAGRAPMVDKATLERCLDWILEAKFTEEDWAKITAPERPSTERDAVIPQPKEPT